MCRSRVLFGLLSLKLGLCVLGTDTLERSTAAVRAELCSTRTRYPVAVPGTCTWCMKYELCSYLV